MFSFTKSNTLLIFTGATVGGFIGYSTASLTISQVAVLEEVSFHIGSNANGAYVGGLVAYSCTLTINDSFCRASFKSDVSPVKTKTFCGKIKI